MMKHTTRLRKLIDREEILLCPGTYDPLMAKLIGKMGFEAMYMTGAGVSHSTLAMPDLGLTTMTEMVHRATQLADASELPLICDADTGYGNALNVMRTVREYERAGVAGIHIEDQEMPKRCGHFFGKSLVEKDEMVGKLKAALDARQDEDFVIIARTDARTAVGFDEALDRAHAYAEAGADVIFFESPRSIEELTEVPKAIGKPVLANMVETGLTPLLSASELQELGYGIVIFAGSLARFLARQAEDFLQNLKDTGTTEAFMDRMNSFKEHNELLELPKFEELAKKYGL
jgi:methylisocitrate lyase